MRVLRKMKYLAAVALFSLSSAVKADVNSDLNDFFNKIGGGSNYTSGTIVQGQSAGYLLGGSFYARTPVRNIQLISITMPSISAGCGGIDAYLGAFSYINSDQLKAMAKMIMSNAIGYAFELGLETTCPQCKMVMDKLQALANDVNSLNVSTCQAAQALVGGITGRRLAQDQQLCNSVAMENNLFSDFLQARQHCGVGGQTDSVLSKAKESRKDEIPRNKNLVWQAFTKINQVVSNDRELKEMMMSMVGTTVYDKNGNMTVLPSLGVNDELISTLLYGGEATMYRCNDTTACLSPTKSKVRITKQNSLVEKVRSTMDGIYTAIMNESQLTTSQVKFVENSRIPVFRHIKHVAMLGVNKDFVMNLSEYIALDYAISYIDSLIMTTEIASAQALGSEEEVKQFQENVRGVRSRLGDTLRKVQVQQDAYLATFQQIESLGKMISPKFRSSF